MAAISKIQNSFSSGELDPKLRARNDVATFYTGAQKMRNVLAIPQGAAKRRPGLEYLHNLHSGEIQMFEFVYSKDVKYIIVFKHLQAMIFKSGILLDTITTDIDGQYISTMTMAQSHDTMLLFHQDMRPKYIVRASETNWLQGDWSLRNIASYNFLGSTTVDVEITNSASGAIDFSEWVEGNTESAALATAASAHWEASHVGNYIRGPLGGYAEIVTINSSVEAVITILSPYTNDTGNGNKTVLTAGEWSQEEPAISSTRGYPACGGFFQGRLWLASSKDIPNGIWASKVNDEEDFQSWIPEYADNGIFMIARDTMTPFQSVFAGKHLMFFSSDGAFFVSKSDTEPITPLNVGIQKISTMGIEPGMRPYEIAGSTVYMRRGGRSVLESTYTFANGSYNTLDLSLLASHLLHDPVSMAYRKQTDTDESDYILVVNGDGTLSVLCTLRTQEITAWTLCETEGLFKNVAVDGDDVYFIIERSINGVPQVYLEKFNDDMLVDCGVMNPIITATRGTAVRLTYDSVQLTYGGVDLTYEPLSVYTASGLDHLDGEELQVITDNTIYPAVTVTSGDAVLTRNNDNDTQLGLNFPIVDNATGSRVFIESMPLEIETERGTSIDKKKRISEVVAMMYETSHIIINKNKVPIRRIGVDTLDSPIPKRSNNVAVSGILGWANEINISIGQTLPLPMTLLGMAYRVRM